MLVGRLQVIDKDSNDKTRAIDAAVSQIERAFGKGSIMRLGQRETVETEV
ncbi:MAG TPA: DNA recombination/repair protein RecA, partial [Rhodospirillales bacterium]|nr:DNA recombination/repair protein RecA [Rhodospirillales bacterium]